MKLGWRFAIVLVAVFVGMYLSRKPWEVYRVQQAKTNDVYQEMKEAEEERSRLMKDRMKLSSPLGKEQTLREQGWHKPGEIPVEK